MIDSFGREHDYLRISVTDRCNLRCLYCIPEENVVWKRRDELLTFEEIERVTRVAVSEGIKKIRITGGEPFARAGCEDLIVRLKQIEGLETLAVTTNGVLLHEHLPKVRNSVDAFNLSLDTFKRDRFEELTGRDRLPEVLKAIDEILDAGYKNLKINAVVMRGVNDDELVDFANFTADRQVSVRFIEFMPFAGNSWTEGKLFPMSQMMEALSSDFELEAIPLGKSPISRDFKVTSRESGKLHLGSVGIIASMSVPFCDGCSRIRLTAEGKIMPCLHSPLEYDLRSLLRTGGTDDDIISLFQESLSAKPEEHPPGDELVAQGSRGMIQIGG